MIVVAIIVFWLLWHCSHSGLHRSRQDPLKAFCRFGLPHHHITEAIRLFAFVRRSPLTAGVAVCRSCHHSTKYVASIATTGLTVTTSGVGDDRYRDDASHREPALAQLVRP
jgi:hypothetical protein